MKPERKVQGSGTLIASLQALLSKAISLKIFQSLRSLLTDSSHVSLGLPLPLFTLSTRLRTPLRTGASGGPVHICLIFLMQIQQDIELKPIAHSAIPVLSCSEFSCPRIS